MPLPLDLNGESHALGLELKILAHDRRAGAVESVTDQVCWRDHVRYCPRLRIVEVEHGFASAKNECAKQAPQFHHFLVVEADVRQHGDLGTIERDRSVTFVDLADE